MTLIADIPASTALLAQLANPAARALGLGVIVGLGLAVFRVKSTSLRLFTWTAVLYSALALPLLGWMLPPLPISAPAFLQNAFLQHPAGAPSKLHLGGVFVGNQKAEQSVPKAAGPMEPSAPIAANAQAKRRQETLSVAADPATSPSILSHIEWNTIASAIYLAVALLLLVRFSVGLGFGHRLLLRSHRIDETRLTVRLASRAKAAGLAIVPLTAESEFISVPLTMGALRSTILLPCDWREWDDAKLDGVLAHEVSHVARRDALTQRLSLLHRAIFWFSPLAWWLDRHLADLGEQASDEAALACGADRKTYARTLLEFFEALQTAPGRVRWQGVSMAKAGQAEQRIERILSWKGSVAMQLKKSITVAVVAFAFPVVYLAASVHPAKARAQSPAPAQTQAPASAPAATAKPAPAPDASPEAEPTIAPHGGVAGTISGGPTAPPMPPPPPQGGVAGGVVGPAPVAPAGPVAVAPVPPSESSHRGFSYHYGFDDEDRFVIVSGKTDSFTMSGTGQDARHVEKLRKNIQGDFIWFQRDETSYVIRDQATIDRARKFWDPQEELGKKQEALGKQQEALGKQQEELAAKMQQIRVNVPDMTAELEKLKAELKQLSVGATVEQVGHLQSEIGELQSKIGNIQSHAGDQQGKIGEEMGALGAKQGKLGEQQGELGRQQGELWREASRQMKQLLDEALAKGLAQPEL